MKKKCEKILELKNISKYFGAVRALEDVNFELYENEILALLGDNAAGKSTLIKIISGVFPPDKGEIWLYGKKVKFSNPNEARKMGIETIYQDLALFDNLDTLSNIFAGREVHGKGLFKVFGIIDRKFMYDETKEALDQLGIGIQSYYDNVRQLSGGQRQSIAIAKVIYWGHKIIIMDEPTAALGVKETRKLMKLIGDLKKHNVSVIIIMHNIKQVMEVAERAIILKMGERVGTREIIKGNEKCYDEIVKMLI